VERDTWAGEDGVEGGLPMSSGEGAFVSGEDEGGWRGDGASLRLGDGAIDETVELEREIPPFPSSGTLYPVSSACGQGVVQMIF
jgi:hypothetical protein